MMRGSVVTVRVAVVGKVAPFVECGCGRGGGGPLERRPIAVSLLGWCDAADPVARARSARLLNRAQRGHRRGLTGGRHLPAPSCGTVGRDAELVAPLAEILMDGD